MNIRDQERDTYDTVCALEAYGAYSPGEEYLPHFLDMSHTTMRGSVLDAGCASGKGGLALQQAGFEVRLCDLTDEGLTEDARRLPFTRICLWDDLKRQIGFVDWVYCCDVLEHIPTPFTMLVVSRLLEVARRGVFLSIALVPDHFGLWVGKPLHQTVQPFTAWRDQLAELGIKRDPGWCKDLGTTGLYLLQR